MLIEPFENAWTFIKMGERPGMPPRWRPPQEEEPEPEPVEEPVEEPAEEPEEEPEEELPFATKMQTARMQLDFINGIRAKHGEEEMLFPDFLIREGLWDEYIQRYNQGERF